MEENPSSCCFKALGEMPSGICVHLSKDAAPQKPPGLGGHHGRSLSCGAAPNPELWVVNRNWSCLFQLDPGALALLAPSPRLPAAAAGAELPVVLLHPAPAALPTSQGSGKSAVSGCSQSRPAVFCVPARHFPNLAAFGHWERCGYQPMGCASQDPKWT